jgi:crotonobetainyl-CoA:carnitine CoA-transferase CaiB-like acyl-CoA transferase
VRNAAECEAPIVDFIAARTLDENMAAFAAAEVTAAPVYDIDQFLADPHVLEREIVVEVPDAETGRIAMHNIIPRLSDTPGRLRLPAPRLGEHTEEILGQFGIARPTLEGLAKDGVIGLG